jgi:HK97 gp10 family phage protein
MNKTSLVIETYGFDGLEKTFDNFQHKDKKRIFIAAFRKSTKPTIEMAKANAPIGKTMNLSKSIGMVPMSEDIGVWLGARVIGGYKGHHGHLVEDGTVDRFYYTKKGNIHRTGKMNPNGRYAGFFRKAADATEEQVINTLTQEWHNAIARFIVRTNKKDA